MASLYGYGSGNWFGLPEFGLTEMFGGNKNSLNNAKVLTAGNNLKQVLGTSTTGGGTSLNSSGGGSGTYNKTSLISDINRLGQSEAKQIDSQANNLSDQIDDLYDASYDVYKGRLGEVPQMESELMGQAQSGYDAQRKNIEYGQGVQLGRLDQNMGEVDTMQKEGSRGIAQDTIASMNAANQKLGAFGASDSSAKNMYGYAIGKQANQLQTQLLNTLNKQRADINMKKQETIADAQNKLSQAENWLQTKKVEIAQYVRQIRNGIKDAMAELDGAKRKEKIDVLKDAYSRVSSRTQQLNNIYLQARASIMNEAQSNVAGLDAYAEQLASRFGANVEQPELASIDTGGQLGQGQGGFVPGAVDDNTREKRIFA